MNKLKVFISSRVNSVFAKPYQAFCLKDLRKSIRDTLEAELFLGENILDVVINETDFNASIERDAFDNCIETMRSCNIIVILYNGEAGWSVTGTSSANGICHEEFLVAVNEFSEMTFVINLSSYFTLPQRGEVKRRNDAFIKDITDSFPHMETIDAVNYVELTEKVLEQISKYLLAAIEKSFITQKLHVAGSSVFGQTLDWSKLSYQQRQQSLESKLKSAFETLPAFKDVIKAYHAIPDNMSVADARNLIGRPFIQEHGLIENTSGKSGVIHFVGISGNATEAQVKGLVGYPDLTVIKAPFGFYLWEQNMHIQMFFLKGCINPQTVRTRLSEVINWLSSSREQQKIKARAESRYLILSAMNKARLTS